MLLSSLRARQNGLLIFLGAFLVGVGILGLGGQQKAQDQSEMLLRDHLKPAILLSKIQTLQAESRSQVLLALQHAPDNAFAKMHDHPVTFHTDRVQKNIDEIDRMVQEFKAMPIEDDKTRQLFADFEQARTTYARDGLLPAREAQLAGDFMKSNEILLKRVNPLFTAAAKPGSELMNHIIDEGEKEQKAAGESFRTFRTLVIAAMVVGLILAFVGGALLIRSMMTAINGAVDVFEEMARGRLDNVIDTRRGDEFGPMMNVLAKLQDDLRRMIGDISGEASALRERSGLLRAEMEQVARRTQDQQARVQEVASSIDAVSASVADVAQSSASAAGVANETLQFAEEGSRRMEDNRQATARVMQAMDESEQTIRRLGDEVQKIGAISQVIKEIADQTNLLALNAAIEAARAGEAGRGFAVVADEVRKLAERTAQSTADIAATIEGVRGSSLDATRSMERARGEVEASSGVIANTGESLVRILESSRRTDDLAKAIAGAARDQSAATENVASNMERISALIEESTTSFREAEQASTELAKTSDRMQQMVVRFRT